MSLRALSKCRAGPSTLIVRAPRLPDIGPSTLPHSAHRGMSYALRPALPPGITPFDANLPRRTRGDPLADDSSKSDPRFKRTGQPRRRPETIDNPDFTQPPQMRPFKQNAVRGSFYTSKDQTPSPAYWQTQIERILSRPEPNALALLDAVTPLLQPGPGAPERNAVLDDFLVPVCQILSSHFGQTPLDTPELPAVQIAVTDTLSHCFARSSGKLGVRPPVTGTGMTEISRGFGEVLAHQAIKSRHDPGRMRVLMDGLREGLWKYKRDGKGFKVATDIVGAWVVLRKMMGKEADKVEPPFIWPSEEALMRWLEAFMGVRGEKAEEYRESVKAFLETGALRPLPGTFEEFKVVLDRMNPEAGLELWSRVRDELDLLGDKQGEGILAPDVSLREAVVEKFIYAFNSPAYRKAMFREETIEVATRDALAVLPGKIPLRVYHTLLYASARIAGQDDVPVEAGDELAPIDGFAPELAGRSVDSIKREHALLSLKRTWAELRNSGTKLDPKAYAIYMESLGELGDVEEMKAAWNALSSDAGCKQRYLESESGGSATASWPPTHILNAFLSRTLRIPGKGGVSLALELFEQCTRPNSTLSCSIYTINTVLRHYARQADVPAMQSLFALAERLSLKPDHVTYTTLLQGLLRAGELELAKHALDAMLGQGIQPSKRMCSLLVADLAKEGEQVGLQHAEELLKWMRRMKMDVDAVTWTGLVSGYFRGGWEEDGWEAVRRMTAEGLQLNRVAYNYVLRQAGEGKTPPTAETLASKIFREMVREGVVPNSDTYMIVLAPLVRAKRWLEAGRILETMRKLNYVPEKSALAQLVKRVRLRRAN